MYTVWMVRVSGHPLLSEKLFRSTQSVQKKVGTSWYIQAQHCLLSDCRKVQRAVVFIHIQTPLLSSSAIHSPAETSFSLALVSELD